MSDIEQKLRSIIETDYPAVLYINFKELGQVFLICQPNDVLNKKINELFEIRKKLVEKGIVIKGAHDYMTETFLPNSIDMMMLVKVQEETKISKKQSHLSNYFILHLGQNLWKLMVDPDRIVNSFMDEKLHAAIKELSCNLINFLPQPDRSAEFIATQLAWLALQFPKLSLYAFSPVSLSETVDCLHFILIEDGTAQAFSPKRIREYFLVSSRNILEVISDVRWQLFLSHALRSAVAAVLARVMAHDLGSHMLANADLSPEPNQEGYFNHLKDYVRARTVFIAEATTADPFWTMSLPLVAQVVYPFQYFDSRLSPVCRHIAQSEGVTKVCIEVKHNGETLSYESDRTTNVWVCKPYDLFVAMPTGLIGNHAFYCILENVIRNGAKYGTAKKGEPLKLSIRVEDKDLDQCKDFYRVRIWDDHSSFDQGQFKTICSFFPPNCRKGIEVDSKEESWRIINEAGQLVAGGWGIKEMRIASAWLRKERLVDALMREDSINPPLLRPIVVDENGNETQDPPQGSGRNYYMGYEFFLLKPKEALIVDSEFKLNDAMRKQLSMRGIDVLDEDLEVVLRQRIRHYALVVKLPSNPSDRQKWLDKLQEKRDELPSVLILTESLDRRLSASVCISEHEYNKLKVELPSGNMPTILLKAYQQWIQETFEPPNNLTLVIQLKHGARTEAPTGVGNLWAETADKFCEEFSPWNMIVWRQRSESLDLQGTIAAYDYHKILYYPVKDGGAGVNPDKTYFYEPCFKNQPAQIVLFNPPQDPFIRLRVALGLVEAAVAKVAIVDERIWGKRETTFINEPGEECPMLIQSMKRRKIFIPDESVIDYENPKNYKDRLVQWLRGNNVKIFVIHQGILDKMFETRDEIEQWVETIKATIPFVIVESDRGEGLLPKLPRNARFVPFSAIETWLTPDGASKFLLVQTLLSATKGG